MKKSIIVFLLCVALSILVSYTEGTDVVLSEEGYLLREESGADDYEAELLLEIEGIEGQEVYLVEVPPKRLTQDEEDALLKSAIIEIENTFLLENESFEYVRGRVRILTEYQEGLVTAEWNFKDAKRISSEGYVVEEGLAQAGEDVLARVELTCEDSSIFHEFYFRVYPVKKSEQEILFGEIATLIKLQGEKEGTDRFALPQEVAGHALTWENQKSKTPMIIVFLGGIIAVLLPALEKQKKDEKLKKRREELLREYPEMVNKLTILLGAGMTLQTAWSKITAMYLNARNKGNMGRKEVYEEMLLTQREIESGKGELKSYEAFGERCGIQKYRKFSNYITQNLKKGNRSICMVLEKEATEVFEERKSRARQYGEEAGTKMLLPMLLMLGIVIVIIMIPAVISFQSGL